MTDTEKIAAILKTDMPDALKVELIQKLLGPADTQPVYIPAPYPVWPDTSPTITPWFPPTITCCSAGVGASEFTSGYMR